MYIDMYGTYAVCDHKMSHGGNYETGERLVIPADSW